MPAQDAAADARRDATGADSIDRLRRQARAVWPRERDLLRALGLRDGMRVLDAGCGPGAVTGQIAELCPGSDIVGLEPDPERAASAARSLAGLAHVHVERGTLAENALADGSFDFAYLRFVLQHVPEPDAALAGALRVLRPGGRVVAVDADDGLVAFDPEPPELAELMRLSGAAQRARGGDRRIGRKLAGLLARAGFRDVAVRALALTSSELGRDAFADLALSFRMRRLRARHGDDVAPLLAAVERYVAGGDWHAIVCVVVASALRP